MKTNIVKSDFFGPHLGVFGVSTFSVRLIWTQPAKLSQNSYSRVGSDTEFFNIELSTLGEFKIIHSVGSIRSVSTNFLKLPDY